MANEFVTRTGLIVSGSTFLPAVTTASKGYILSFDDTTKQVYYMSTSSVTVTVPGSDTQVLYNNGGAFGAASNFVFSGSRVGINKTAPSTTLDISGSVLISGSLTVSGSSTFTNIGPAIFSGSLTQNASTASFGGVVGIGTTTPAYKLDVNGTGRFASGLDVDSYILTRTKLQISNGRLFELIGTSDALNIYDGSAGLSRIYISGSGNVGIGITTPGYRLEVKSGASNSFFTSFTPSAGSGAISIYQDSNNHPSIYGANASGTVNIVLNTNGVSYLQGGNVIVGGSNDDGSTFQVKGNVTATSFTGSFTGSIVAPGSTTQVLFNSGGALAAASNFVFSGSNVGIGTTSPSSLLHVSGTTPTVTIEGSSTNSAKINLVGSFTTWALENQYVNGATNDMFRIYNSQLGANAITINRLSNNVGIGTTSPNAKLDVNGNVLVTGSLTVSGSSTFTNIGPAVFTGSITQNASTASFGGLVGIGTTTPGAIVDIASNGGRLRLTQNTAGSTFNGIDFVSYNGTAYGGFIGNQDTGEIRLNTISTYFPTFYSSGAEVMRITTTGNVGIGTTSPSTKFVVSNAGVSGLEVDPTGGVSSGVLLQAYNRSTSAYMAQSYYALTHTFNVGSGGGTRALDITSAGNVGIGTTSPSAKLHVSSTGETTLTIDSTSSGTARINLTGAGGGAGAITSTVGGLYLNASGNNPLTFNTSGSERMRVAGDGNVGIGITSPSTPLHIAKNSTYNNVSTAAFRIANITSPNKGIDFGYDNTADVGFIQGIEFGVQAKNLSLQSDGGSVGIGTTTPAAKLEIVGASGLQIRNGAADGFSFTQANTNSWAWTGLTGGSNYSIQNANVGIGTTAPTATLEVIGNVKATSFTGSFSGSVSAPGSTTQIVYSSGGALAADSGLVYSGSKVGIGTSSPLSLLSLSKSGLVDLQFNASDQATDEKLWVWQGGSPVGTGVYRLRAVNDAYSNGINALIFTRTGISSVTSAFTGGNVGIGTTTPSTALTVAGAISSSGATYVGGNLSVGTTYNGFAANINGTTYVIGGNVWVNDEYGYANANSANTGFYPSSSSDIKINSAGTTRMFIASGSGNVGIGTTSPDTPLVVQGGAAGTGGWNRTATLSATYPGLIFNSNGTKWGGMAYDYSAAMRFWVNASNNDIFAGTLALSILNNGNVGIGNSDPTYKLDVNGTGRFVGNSGAPALQITDGGSTFSVLGISGSQAGDVNWLLMSGYPSAGNFTIRQSDTVNALVIQKTTGAATFSAGVTAGGGNFVVHSNGNASIGNSTQIGTLYIAGDTTIATNANIGSNGGYMTLQKAGGNVGIGTSSPGAKLDIVSTGAGSEGLRVDGSGGGFAFVVKAGSDYTSHIRAGATVGVNYFTTPPSNGLIVEGNVGIGTTNPISGQGTPLTLASSTGYVGLTLSGSGAYSHLWQLYASGDGGSNKFFGIYDSTNAVYRLVTTSTGNVGIGTTNPTYNLHVSSSGYYGGNLTVEGTITAQKLNVQQVTSSVIYSSGSNVFGNSLANTQTFTGSLQVTGSTHYFLGNVGIGITSPNSYNGYSTLTLNGSTGGVVDFESGGSRIATINNPGSGLDIYTMVAAPIVFGTDTTARMTITSGGKVGIGTSTPTSLLYVYNDIAWSAANLNELTGSAMAFKVRSRNSINSEIVMGAMGDDNTGLQAINNSTAAALKFVINPFGGNVGIGTTNPSELLHISGAGATAKISSTNTYARVDLSTTNNQYYLQVEDSGFDGIGFYKAAPGTAGWQLVVNTDGNVGISNTSPTAYSGYKVLHLGNGSTGNTGLLKFGTGATADGPELYASGNSLRLNTNSSTNVLNLSGSYVGIGTTDPIYKFNVITDAISGRQNLAAIDRTSKNFVTFTNPQYSVDASMGLILRVFPQSDARQGAGIIASGGSNNGDTDLDLFVSTGVASSTSYSALKIKSDGNVGIGTSSPGAKLDITGNVRTSTYYNFNGNPSNPGDATAAVYDQSGVGPTLSGLSVALRAGSTPAEIMRVTSTGVGIGTTSPDRSLLVSGSIGAYVADGQGTVSITVGEGSNVGGNIISLETNAIANTTRLYNNGTGTNFNIGSTGASSDVYLSSRKDIALKVNNGADVFGGTTALFITGSTGNVGIGTTTPAQKLEIFGLSDVALRIHKDSVGEAIVGISGSAGASTTQFITNTNGFDFRGGSNTFPGGGSSRLFISSSGNVGIGTTTPASKLDVNGSIQAGSGSTFGIGADGASIYMSATSGVGLSGNLAGYSRNLIKTDGTSVIEIGDTGTSIISAINISAGDATGVIALKTGGNNTRLFISSSGNVGIGTTTPVLPLQVSGRAQFGDTASMASFTSAPISIRTTGTESITLTHTAVQSWSMGVTSTGTFALRDIDTPADRLVVTQAGNVGIGTTTPSTKLFISGSHVSGQGMSTFKGSDYAIVNLVTPATGDGSIGYWGFRVQDSSFNDLMWFGHVTSSTQSGFVVAPNFDTTNSASLYVARSNGNVGIGTTNPTGKLTISQNNSGGVAALTFTEDESTIQGSSANTKILMGGNLSLNAASTWIAGTNGSERMRITSGGNVGIGTTSPSAPLTVAGTTDLAWAASTSKLQISRDSTVARLQNYENGSASTNLALQWEGGKVGVGTASPTNKLHVSSTEDNAYALRVQGTTENVGGAWTGIGIAGEAANTKTAILFEDIGVSYSRGKLHFALNNVDDQTNATPANAVMTLLPGGNVGIGTTSPGYKLEVNGSTWVGGTVYINRGVNSTEGYIYFDHSGTQVWKQGIFNDNTSTFSIGNGGGFTRLFNITNTGNVGIGVIPSSWSTVTPMLQIGSGGAFIGGQGNANIIRVGVNIYYDGSNWRYINSGTASWFETANGGFGWYSSPNGNAGDIATINNLMILTAAGNFGIGTPTPSYKLQVSGSIAIENQGTTTIESTTFAGTLTSNTNIAFVPTGSFKAAFFDYYVASGSVNMRAGTVMAVHNNSTSRYTDTSTADIGTTAAVDFSTSIVAGSLVLTANIASGTWEVKTAYRAL